MFRLLSRKTQKMLPLGRWRTDKAVADTLRLVDLANYDSCGTCGLPQPDVPKEKYIIVEDNVIYIGGGLDRSKRTCTSTAYIQ